MIKNKIKIIFVLILLLFLANVGFASALEITYPKIPFYPDINNCTGQDCMAKFISYWFGFGIMLAGVIALISLIIASVQLIASAGNPGVRGDAIDRIKGALLGVVLLLSSFIIMRTINPTLVTPSLTPLGEVPGVFYTSGEGGEVKPAPISESDTANIPSGFETIIYKCADGAYSPNLYIWEFPQKNFIGNSGGYDGINVKEISCGEHEDIGGIGSFKMAFKTPGVYYFLGDNCSGYMSGPVLSDEAQIADPFKGNIKSIRAINDDNSKFGFVVHNDINFRGLCDWPHIITVVNNNCTPIPAKISAFSINIFNSNSDIKSSGNGVVFYSEPFGKESRTPGAQSGYRKLYYEEINRVIKNGLTSAFADKIKFSYEGVNVSEPYKINCETFKNCPGSIKIEGHYLVGLYSGSAATSPAPYCQFFREDAPNLNAEEFMGEGRELFMVDVIPIK